MELYPLRRRDILRPRRAHHAEKCFHLLIGVVPGPAEPKQDGVQETILFLPLSSQLKERNLRCVTAAICWREQRRLFHELAQAKERREPATTNAELLAEVFEIRSRCGYY